MSARHILMNVFLWLGVGLELVACVGVFALREVYDRLHFSGPANLGAVSIAIAVVIDKSFSLVGDKAILIAVFLVLASPLVAHATARAARFAEHGDWRVDRNDPSVEVREQ